MMSQREKMIGLATAGVVGLFALNAVLLDPLTDRLRAAEQGAAVANLERLEADNLFQRRRSDRREWREVAGQSILTDRSRSEGQLLNAVPAWANDAGLDLSSLKPERTEREHGFGKVTVRATAQGDLEAVGRFLFAVESAAIPVRVADMTLASRDEQSGNLTVQIGLETIFRLPPEDGETSGGAR